MSYIPLIDLKNGFWPVVHLLYGISEWNFTDMLNIKGYIFLVRTVTLTFPVHELSALDWSENGFWPVVHLLYGVSEWNFTDMLTIKGYILWLRTSYHCLSQFCCYLGIIYLKNNFWCPQQWRGITQCLRCFYSVNDTVAVWRIIKLALKNKHIYFIDNSSLCIFIFNCL